MSGPSVFPHTPLPREGLATDEVLSALAERKGEDRDWRGGRVFSLVYSADEELDHLLEQALGLYAAENGLNVLAFPSIGLLQHDLVEITASLLGAGEPSAGGQVQGYLTSGGTESLLQVVKVARDVARDERGISRPKVIATRSAHAAFTKAADYFDVELVRLPVGDGYRADPAAFAAAIDDRTILLVGSAPSYPHGVIDPIEELADLALRHELLFHVDACMGGYLLPFLSELGRLDQPFDFRVPGVTSMSADLHKYGYATKGVSVALYRTPELARRQLFVTSDWDGGLYASTAVAGTRPAGPIAAAWAAVMHLGHDGYLRLAEEAHDAALVLRRGVDAIDGLALVGDPPATVMAIRGAEGSGVDVFAVGDALSERGWYLDRQKPPESLHATVHARHAATVGELVGDLATAVEGLRGVEAADRSTTYGVHG